MVKSLVIAALAFASAGDDKEVEEALKAFSKSYNNPNASARAAAVAELSRTKNDKIAVRLAALLQGDETVVRIAAADGLGTWTENKPKIAVLLISGLGGANAKEPKVQSAIFAALGKLGEESALPTVHRSFEEKDTTVAKAAIDASGGIRSRNSIDVLVELIKDLEKIKSRGGKGGGAGVNVGGYNVPGGGSDPQQQRVKDLLPAALKAMQSITLEKYTTSEEWVIWWNRNRDKFKVPPPAPPTNKKK